MLPRLVLKLTVSSGLACALVAENSNPVVWHFQILYGTAAAVPVCCCLWEVDMGVNVTG